MSEDILTEVEREVVDRCSGNLPNMAEVEMLVAIIDRLAARVRSAEAGSVAAMQSEREYREDSYELLERMKAADAAVERLTTALAECEVRALRLIKERDYAENIVLNISGDPDPAAWFPRFVDQPPEDRSASLPIADGMDDSPIPEVLPPDYSSTFTFGIHCWVCGAKLTDLPRYFVKGNLVVCSQACASADVCLSETHAARIIEESYAAARRKHLSETTGIRGVCVTDATQDLESTSGVIPRAEARPAAARAIEDSYGAGWSAGYEAAKRELPCGTTASDSMRVEKRPADEEAEIATIRERQAHGVEDCPVCGEDLGATRDRAALLVALDEAEAERDALRAEMLTWSQSCATATWERDESRRIRVADLAMMQNAYEERLEELKAERDALAVRVEKLREELKTIGETEHRSWKHGLNTYHDFALWAQNRARAALKEDGDGTEKD